jgi:hypothetical protein
LRIAQRQPVTPSSACDTPAGECQLSAQKGRFQPFEKCQQLLILLGLHTAFQADDEGSIPFTRSKPPKNSHSFPISSVKTIDFCCLLVQSSSNKCPTKRPTRSDLMPDFPDPPEQHLALRLPRPDRAPKQTIEAVRGVRGRHQGRGQGSLARSAPHLA